MNIEQLNHKVFAELGREKQLMEYHDIIFKLLGVVIDFINADGMSLKLSKMKHFNPFCARLRAIGCGFAACQTCDREYARSAALSGQDLIYKCYTGLTEIVVPLFDRSGNYIGCMTSGQFHQEGDHPLPAEQIVELAKKYELDPNELEQLYRQTRVLSAVQVEGIIDYLKAIGRTIIRMHNHLIFLETVDSPDKISLIKQYVEDNYMEPLSVPGVARKFYVSPGYFSHFFRREVGVSFINYVNMFRIGKAEELLLQTDCSISEIASQCGFGSISQFNRTFKNLTGRSARDFRNSIKTDS